MNYFKNLTHAEKVEHSMWMVLSDLRAKAADKGRAPMSKEELIQYMSTEQFENQVQGYVRLMSAEEMPKEPEEVTLQSAEILWHEGLGEFDGDVVGSWNDLHSIFLQIRNQQGPDPIGYDKVKIKMTFSNGFEYEGRIDCGPNGGDFDPTRESAQEYIKNQMGYYLKGSEHEEESQFDRINFN